MIDDTFYNRCETVSVIKVSHTDVEDLIDTYFGNDKGFLEYFCLPEVERLGMFSMLSLDIRQGQNTHDDLLRTTPVMGKYQNISTKCLLTSLCDDGIIQPGEYLIHIEGD